MVLHRAQPAQLLPWPSLVVVPEVGVRHPTELGNRRAESVAMVVELEALRVEASRWNRRQFFKGPRRLVRIFADSPRR